MLPKTTGGRTALVLGVLLVVSNVWWLAVTIDHTVSFSYLSYQARAEERALEDALALIPASKPTASRSEITEFLQQRSKSNSFEKDGCVWFDNLGVQFGDDGRIIHVSRSWSFGEADPCFPEDS